MSEASSLYTIGHSNHEMRAFAGLLSQHDITAIADVRSTPYSGRNPQFNRETLRTALTERGVAYVFLGDELGARRTEPEAYVDDVAQYDRIAQLPAFREGLDRVREGVRGHRVALMCAERDPITCHRTVLVCRHLRSEMAIDHVLADGRIESMAEAETRMITAAGLSPGDLFSNRAEQVDLAYERLSAVMGYVRRSEVGDGGSQAHKA